MKYLFSLCLFLLFAMKSISQEKHFIFIQSDNKQLFNVSINGKLYSANSSGYVIIPKLMDGEYNLIIGFPSNTFPDQGFKCVINKKDLGFGLKDFAEKGWGLFNLQTLDVTMSGGIVESPVAVVTKLKTGDEPISFDKKSEPVKPIEPTKPIIEKVVEIPANENNNKVETTVDTAINISQISPFESISTEKKSEASNEVQTPTTITKLTEEKNASGVSMAYTDNNGSVTDTIVLSIPNADSLEVNLAKTDSLRISRSDSAINAKIAILNQRQDDVKVIEIDVNAKKEGNADASTPENKVVIDTAVSVAPSTTVNSSETIVVKPNNNYCQKVASEEDYMKLRRKMALESSDEKMIKEAKKAFKDKCFATHQLKGLSSLFLSDEGRFRFFAASYSFVSDPAAFPMLQSLLIDPNFINRFNSIIQ